MENNFIEVEDIERINRERLLRVQQYAIRIDAIVKGKTDDIIDKLIVARKAKGLTQQDIADMVGVKAPNIARFEKKKSTPTFQFLEKYADAVGLEFTYSLLPKKK